MKRALVVADILGRCQCFSSFLGFFHAVVAALPAPNKMGYAGDTSAATVGWGHPARLQQPLVTLVRLLTFKPPCRLISLDFRQK